MKALFRDNLDMIRKNCKENIASVNVNLVQSCINLVEVLYDQMKESYGNDIHKLSSYELDNLVNMILIFSFIWSAGGNLTDNPKDNRDFFSREIKQKVLKLLQTFPIEGEVYDYYIDFKLKEFRPWSERVKEFV
jgi:dynein heavy chain